MDIVEVPENMTVRQLWSINTESEVPIDWSCYTHELLPDSKTFFYGELPNGKQPAYNPR